MGGYRRIWHTLKMQGMRYFNANNKVRATFLPSQLRRGSGSLVSVRTLIFSSSVHCRRHSDLMVSLLSTLFFYKNIFYNNIEAEICEILRIF